MASDLDIHSLILAGVQAEPPDRLKTADEVIKEIDDIMDVSAAGAGSAGDVRYVSAAGSAGDVSAAGTAGDVRYVNAGYVN